MPRGQETVVPHEFRCLAAISMCVALALAGCGGSDHGGTPPPPAAPTFTVGGTVSGLASGAQITLNDNAGDPLVVSANGGFTFATPIALGGSYAVTIGAQPSGQTCTLLNGTGTGVTANVGSVSISCIVGPEFAYVVNVLDFSVSQYAIGANGVLTPMSVPKVSTGELPQAIAVDPSGRFAYVPNEYSNTVTQYSIGDDGALTAMSTLAITNAVYPNAVTVDPAGRFVYVAAGGILQYAIGSDGALTAVTTPAVGPPEGLTYLISIDRTGRFAYVNSEGSNVVGGVSTSVAQFTIGTDGVFTAMSPPTVAAGASPLGLALDPSGRFAYVANYDDGTVSQYTIGTNGALTAMSPPTVPAAIGARSVAVDPSGRFVYVTNTGSGTNTISQYTIGANGALTAMNPPAVPSGTTPYAVTVDPSGRFVYAVNNSDNTVSQYAIGIDGALTALSTPTVQTSTTPSAITIFRR